MNMTEKAEYIKTRCKKDLPGLEVYIGKLAIYFDIQEISVCIVGDFCVSPRIKRKKEKNIILYPVLN